MGGVVVRKRKSEEDKDMSVTKKELSVTESLTEAFEEVERIRSGKQPKTSWQEMIEQIKKDRDSGNL